MKHHDIFRRFVHRAIHVFGLFAALSLVHVSVNAQSPFPMPKRLDRFHVVVDGNIVKANYIDGYEGYGIHPYTKAQMNGTAVPGGVSLSKQLAINTKNGLVVADATQKISARQIAKGITTVASGPLGLALLAAPLIIDLLSDADLKHEDGQWKGDDPDTCTTAPCYEYRYLTSPELPWTRSTAQACTAGFARVQGSSTTTVYTYKYFAPPSTCEGERSINGATPTRSAISLDRRTASVQAPQYIPITTDQAIDAIAAQNPGPEVLQELDNKGQHAPMPDPADAPKVENPTPSQEKTSVKTNPDGSTETEVCKTNATTTGNQLKLSETCTLTKRDPSGVVTDTSTKTSEDGTGTANTEPSMLCTLFPKIVACAVMDTPTQEIPKKTETVDFDAEDIGFGPGQCPAPFAWNDSLGQHELDLTAYCNALESYIQPIVVLMAAFAAFMIVAGGINRE